MKKSLYWLIHNINRFIQTLGHQFWKRTFFPLLITCIRHSNFWRAFCRCVSWFNCCCLSRTYRVELTRITATGYIAYVTWPGLFNLNRLDEDVQRKLFYLCSILTRKLSVKSFDSHISSYQMEWTCCLSRDHPWTEFAFGQLLQQAH